MTDNTEKLLKEFDSLMDESYPPYVLKTEWGVFRFYPSQVLKTFFPITYGEMFNDWKEKEK